MYARYQMQMSGMQALLVRFRKMARCTECLPILSKNLSVGSSPCFYSCSRSTAAKAILAADLPELRCHITNRSKRLFMQLVNSYQRSFGGRLSQAYRMVTIGWWRCGDSISSSGKGMMHSVLHRASTCKARICCVCSRVFEKKKRAVSHPKFFVRVQSCVARNVSRKCHIRRASSTQL